MKKVKKETIEKGIRKLSKGVYEVSFFDGLGQRKYATIHSESIKEVREERAKSQIATKNTSGTSLSQKIKHASFDEIWIEIEGSCLAKGNSKKTIGEYKKRFFRLFKEFQLAKGENIKRTGELTEAYLNRYVAWYVNGYKSKVKIRDNPASEVNVIKILLGKLKKLGHLSRDLYEEIKGFIQLQDNEDENYPNISNTELKKLFSYIENDDISYYYFFVYLLWTGRRPMETAKILKGQVEWRGINDPVRVKIKSPTAKNRRKDQVDLHYEKDIDLKAAIVNAFNHSNRLNSPYLFCNRFRRQISSTNQEVYIKKVSKAVLDFEISAKYFRKRYATMCGLSRVPVKDAMARSGHKDVEIFVKHYQQPTQDGISAVVDAIGLDSKQAAQVDPVVNAIDFDRGNS